jgi:hypothetical protein
MEGGRGEGVRSMRGGRGFSTRPIDSGLTTSAQYPFAFPLPASNPVVCFVAAPAPLASCLFPLLLTQDPVFCWQHCRILGWNIPCRK